MGKKRVVRRVGKNNLTEEGKEKIKKQQEERGKQALGRARATIKASPQTEKKQESIQKVTQGETSQKYGQETTGNQKARQASNTKPKLRKRKRFEDKHKRMTTYVLLENHQKLNDARMNYGIPITETVNNALQEYFAKYNL